MSLLSVVIPGLIIGFTAAAPTGPSGVLVIERTLDRGRLYGLFSGFGISLSDFVYIVCSSIGVTFLANLISSPEMSRIVSLVGCALLLGFGIFTVKNNPLKKVRSAYGGNESSFMFAFFSGFLVAIVNPLVMLIYISLFAYFHLALGGMNGLEMVVGYTCVLAGDLLWWMFLTFLIDKLRNRFDLRGIWIINRILGGLLIAASVVWAIVVLV